MPRVLCYAECRAIIDRFMKIRRARVADLEAAAELWYQRMAMLRESASWIKFAPDAIDSWSRRAMMWLDDAEVAFHVAEADERIIGLAVVADKEAEPGLRPARIGVLLEIAVDLHHPHTGLSGRLLEVAKSWLRSRDIAILEIAAPANYPVEDAFWRAQDAVLSARNYRLRL